MQPRNFFDSEGAYYMPIHVPNPAPGVDPNYGIPADTIFQPILIAARFVSGAGVANRVIHVNLTTAGTTAEIYVYPAFVLATNDISFSIHAGAGLLNTTPLTGFAHSGMASNLRLYGGDAIHLVCDLIAAADQWSNICILGRHWGSPIVI